MFETGARAERAPVFPSCTSTAVFLLLPFHRPESLISRSLRCVLASALDAAGTRADARSLPAHDPS
jgi:hypothetical protein